MIKKKKIYKLIKISALNNPKGVDRLLNKQVKLNQNYVYIKIYI